MAKRVPLPPPAYPKAGSNADDCHFAEKGTVNGFGTQTESYTKTVVTANVKSLPPLPLSLAPKLAQTHFNRCLPHHPQIVDYKLYPRSQGPSLLPPPCLLQINERNNPVGAPPANVQQAPDSLARGGVIPPLPIPLLSSSAHHSQDMPYSIRNAPLLSAPRTALQTISTPAADQVPAFCLNELDNHLSILSSAPTQPLLKERSRKANEEKIDRSKESNCKL